MDKKKPTPTTPPKINKQALAEKLRNNLKRRKKKSKE